MAALYLIVKGLLLPVEQQVQPGSRQLSLHPVLSSSWVREPYQGPIASREFDNKYR